MPTDPMTSLIQAILSGANTATGLGTNPPAAVGVNPVRGLPTPDLGGALGGIQGMDFMQLLAQWLPQLAPFFSAISALAPSGISGTASATDPMAALTQLLPQIGGGATPTAGPVGRQGPEPKQRQTWPLT